MALTLRTLGTLEASTLDPAGATRHLGRGKPVALLAYLASVPGHRASREHLAGLLWGDVESEAARQNLRQTLWYLKKKLGDGLIEGAGDILVLSTAFTSDRDEFLQAAQRADFLSAIHRYRGDFIPEFAAPGATEFEQWCDLERRRLCVTFLRSADAVARQWLSEGKFRDAQELARRARDVDPMDQATWRLLLEAHLAGSDGLGAATEAEHFEAFLEREEQEPEAASTAAIRAARRAPSVAEARTDAGPSIAAELVGREGEFSTILAAWEQARAGTPRHLLIAAAAGLGKSRLLRDVQARLKASRARVLLVRANPGDRLLTGGFLAEVVAQLAALSGAAAVSTGTASVLVALAPALASTYPNAAPDASIGEDAVRRRALAIVDLARAVAEEHPVALLLDDLHWADEHSARVLTAAFARLEQTRVLVVMAKRPIPDPRALFVTFERVELPPLDLAAVTAFVAQVAELPVDTWAEQLPLQLLAATGGSPLLLVETLHHVMEQGWLSVSADRAWTCGDATSLSVALRDGGAVRQRIHRLGPAARQVLLALAAAGRPLTLDDLGVTLSSAIRTIEEEIGTLELAGFVARHGSTFVVSHDEIADAVLDAAAEDDRRRMHRAIADALLTADDSDETAMRRAAEHGQAAGDDGIVRLAWHRYLGQRRVSGDRRATGELAAELLGVDPTSPRASELARRAPFLRRRRARWMLAAAALLTAAGAAGARWAARPPAPLTADFGIWVEDSVTHQGQLVGVQLSGEEVWDAGVPIKATPLDASAYPTRSPHLADAIYRAPGGKAWVGNAIMTDLGEEPIWIDSAGKGRLILPSPSDESIADVSPDGQQFLAVTARYDTITDHLQVVAGHPGGSDIRRLTHSVEKDGSARWRPDGSQIAFSRQYFSKRAPSDLCLVDADASHEVCRPLPLAGEFTPASWLDNRRLLLSDEGLRLFELDVATWQLREIRGVLGQPSSMGGNYLLCRCRQSMDEEPSMWLIPANAPDAARPIVYNGHPLRGEVRISAPVYAAGAWLDRLEITMRHRELTIDNVHLLRARGTRADGGAWPPHDVRWTSRDTSVAIVDSTGRLRPRRLGELWIVATAGGWRTDSTRVRIVPPSFTTVAREDWRSDWTTRWRAFGEPRPRVIASNRGSALLPNGDGSYPSGVYSQIDIGSVAGAGVEFMTRMTVTRLQWQTLNVELLDRSHRRVLDAWDATTAYPTAPPMNPVCEVGFPAGEGGRALDAATLSGGRALSIPAKAAWYQGTWLKVRLQLLPDGRCAVAVNDEPIAAIPGIASPSGRIFLKFAGHDRFGGELIVGPVEAWSGVKGGIDWTRLDR